MRKEITERRLKTVVSKLESYLKSQAGGKLSQEQINAIGKFSDHELEEQYEIEKELEEEIAQQLENLQKLPGAPAKMTSTETENSLLEQMTTQL